LAYLPIRRVVTGHNAEGRSCFIMDGAPPHVYSRSPGSSIVTELWETRSAPAANTGDEDPTARPFRLPPPNNGTVFRIIVYPPDTERLAALQREHEAQGSEDVSGRASAMDRSGARHPGFHKTNSVDYAIVLSGEIYAMMDEGETLLRQGDVLVQRGTNHAWSNRSELPAVVALVLVDAKPI
jgi:mannose-6-phosphate isomerase-like protein (cupin superfamily)